MCLLWFLGKLTCAPSIPLSRRIYDLSSYYKRSTLSGIDGDLFFPGDLDFLSAFFCWIWDLASSFLARPYFVPIGPRNPASASPRVI